MRRAAMGSSAGASLRYQDSPYGPAVLIDARRWRGGSDSLAGAAIETHGAIASGDDEGLSLDKLGLQADWVNVLPLSNGVTTLAEILRAAGYRTGAMCANSAYLSRVFNMDQGFDAYVDVMGSDTDWRPHSSTPPRSINANAMPRSSSALRESSSDALKHRSAASNSPR